MDFIAKYLREGLAFLGSLPAWFLSGSPLKRDEEVVIFPTNGYRDGGDWVVDIHAWVLELERGSLFRKLATHAMGEVLENFGVSEEQAHSELFQDRLRWFMADNERNKRLQFCIGDQVFRSPRSGANGHTEFQIRLKSGGPGEFIDIDLINPNADQRRFTGQVQLVPETGVSVISDMDDTIKISQVPDREALVKNLLFRRYEVTPGMPEYYQKLAAQGANFHYVSAAPWQIHPSQAEFMAEHYPHGSLNMRHFRPTDSSFIRFFMSSEDYKLETIRRIIGRYPKHRFLLMGDSGERDPEVYAQIYSEFPEQIKAVLVRVVEGSDLSAARLSPVRSLIPGSRLVFFPHPSELPDSIMASLFE